MASVWTLRLHAPLFQGPITTNGFELRKDFFGIAIHNCPKWTSSKVVNQNPMFRALGDSASTSDTVTPVQDVTLPSSSPELSVNPTQDDVLPSTSSKLRWSLPLQKFQGSFRTLPPLILYMKRHSAASYSFVFIAAATFLIVFLKSYLAKKSKSSQPGSVADLVRRGQLRSDRRGISTPLKFEDPFNNPMVKVGKSNSTVEVCGKVYRLAPVTLTKEEQANHKRRRSRAYQWKRPELFLKEGDTIPSDVDPDTVRWIPANHPFATTASEIDEDLAQQNVYQKNGVPFRIRAEHEALQKKLEALQKGQKLGKLVVDPGGVKEFERQYKSRLKAEDEEQNPSNSSKPLNSEFDNVNKSSPEENEKS